jgi:hypothetical protein
MATRPARFGLIRAPGGAWVNLTKSPASNQPPSTPPGRRPAGAAPPARRPVALEHRLGVHRGPPVGQVGGPAVEPRRDPGAVALHLEEVDGVVDQRPEQGPAGRDRNLGEAARPPTMIR